MIYYCMAVGAMDAVTGLLLVFVPEITLSLMGLEMVQEPVLLRWIGVFVFSVGCMYLLPFLTPAGRDRLAQLVLSLKATALARACVACFVVVAIVGGQLEIAWGSVAAVDCICAVIQLTMLWRGRHGKSA